MTKIIFEPATNTLSVEGHKGKGCTDITKDLEKALGKVSSKKKTQEYYSKVKTTQTIKN